MAKVLTAMDLMKGKTSQYKPSNGLIQPIQMISREAKTDMWKAQNLDWFEQLGLKQLKIQAKRILKNYNLAKGIIDRSDYIQDEANEYSDIIRKISSDQDKDSALSLKFYPIIPNIINLLVGEFAKRTNKVLVSATDQYSKNERIEAKRSAVESYLTQEAQAKIAAQLEQQGIAPDSQEGQEAMSQYKSLPEIEEFFTKSYRGIAEQWASHQLEVDEERFRMFELENTAFRDSLITDSEFWHIKLEEDDYQVELWHPLNTFFHKSPDVRYVSEGNYVGRILMMSIPDVIDRYGYKMDADQIAHLETCYNISTRAVADGHDYTQYYDTSKPYSMQYPNSVHYEKLMAYKDMHEELGEGKAWYDFLYSSNDMFTQGMVRVTEVYWKSQRKVGWLTKKDEIGNIIFKKIITEDYVVTDKPEYDNTVVSQKTKDNLLFGEHIDWFWINETWKGIKVGANYSTLASPFDPVYLDVAPLPFQFKGTDNPFRCRLPVEGAVFSDRSTRPVSPVDQMKPFQIMFNMVNNQTADILVDELGTVILLDQGLLPKHSMGEEWGRGNMAKAYVAMKNFQILPIDTSLANQEGGPINFNQMTALNLQQTERLMSRLQIAAYAKAECFSIVGVTPQRVGNVTASESATGTQQAVNNSYAQTEMLFVQHMSFLMPRVKELMINAAQYYNSLKPSVQLSYINSKDENVFFEIEGAKLMLRDLNIYCNSKPDQRAVLEQLKQLALNNNTSGASIYDLAKVMESNSTSEVLSTLKASVEAAQEQVRAQQEHEQMLLDKQIEATAAEEQAVRDAESVNLDKKLANDRYVAEVKSLSFAKDSDIDDSGIPDSLEVQRFALDQNKHTEDILFKRDKMDRETETDAAKLSLEQRKLAMDKYKADMAYKIAKENKTQAEMKKKKK